MAADALALGRDGLNTFERHSRSPALAGTGLALAAPPRITLAGGAPLPVHGTYRVPAAEVNRFRSFGNEIVVVAVEADTHMPHSTNLVPEGFTPAPSFIDPSQRAFRDMLVGGWFNLDLFDWMPGLGRRQGRVYVFATIGTLVSSTVTVELQAEPAAKGKRAAPARPAVGPGDADTPPGSCPVSFGRTAASPDVDESLRGVVLRVESASSAGDLTALTLHGAYQVTAADAGRIGVTPLHRALVVTVVSGLYHRSFRLAGEVLTFPDDETVAAGVARGYFHLDLLPSLHPEPGQRGTVLVSLGEFVSNVVEIAP